MPPLAEWTRRLAVSLRTKGVPFWAVDASCIVPMPLVATRPERAYAFRTASRRLAAATLAHVPTEVVPRVRPAIPTLPFEPVDAEDLDDRAIARLVASASIDHGVGPVRDLRGGSVAGYARWEAFRSRGLASYAARRNDAAVDGTSRLSPWLHYGHVSPFRIARDAAAVTGPGPDKFLDELLVWRDVAWHFAAHTEDLESFDALPAWARETLARHADDPRRAVSLERLERGATGDVLWDLAQTSLVRHGELHNNVRMTWGKAVPAWTRTPEEARRALVHLNHRYALDGRDPASYGGLYWCLGLFDRPFASDLPVLGTLRPRPTAHHAERLDLDAYAARVRRPSRSRRRVAVIGAGVCGLTCGRTLSDHGMEVVVFDKGRAPGGRLATRRTNDFEVDLGAQYFTARDPRFTRFVPSWIEDGIVAPWRGRIVAVDGRGGATTETPLPVDRFVGTPGMNALRAVLARDVDVRTGHRVDAVARHGDRYDLRGTVARDGETLGPRDPNGTHAPEDFGAFDVLVVCVPPFQARDLLRDSGAHLVDSLPRPDFEPCVAFGFVAEGDALRGLPFDGLFVGRDGEEGRLVTWMARTSSKPGRPEVDAWTVHTDGRWSEEHLRSPADVVEETILADVARVLGLPRLRAERRTLQRWAFARAVAHVDGFVFDEDARLGVGGDWTAGGRVEGAFLSGLALAGRVLGLAEVPGLA
ncbi:MAG: NAD(P)-binding protein [Polyangiaceae bacterium]